MDLTVATVVIVEPDHVVEEVGVLVVTVGVDGHLIRILKRSIMTAKRLRSGGVDGFVRGRDVGGRGIDQEVARDGEDGVEGAHATAFGEAPFKARIKLSRGQSGR
jgi:hypothetical protein